MGRHAGVRETCTVPDSCTATIDFAIRLGFIALLGYWSFRVIAPFLTIGLWSAILAVALYPLFDWLARWLSPRAAALLVTLLCLMVVVGPITWLALGMIGGVSSLVKDIDTGQLTFPFPPEAVKGWAYHRRASASAMATRRDQYEGSIGRGGADAQAGRRPMLRAHCSASSSFSSRSSLRDFCSREGQCWSMC
jgi:hypothetical protein